MFEMSLQQPARPQQTGAEAARQGECHRQAFPPLWHAAFHFLPPQIRKAEGSALECSTGGGLSSVF